MFRDPARHPAHQLYRFPAKIHPPAARRLVREYSCPGDTVTDVFGGSGTVALEAQLAGRRSVSHDIDPLAVLITRCKIGRLWPNSARRVREQVDEVIGRTAPLDEDRVEARISEAAAETVDDLLGRGFWLPEHPNLTHWYSNRALRDLAHLHRAVGRPSLAGNARRVAWLAFAKVARAASNADPVPASGLEVTTHFRELVARKTRVNNPARLFCDTFAKFRDLLASSDPRRSARGHAATRRDAGKPYRGPVRPCQVVVTSPPYGVAVDYARRHSLEHYWLGFVKHQAAKVELGRRYIGRSARRGRVSGSPPPRGPVAAAVAQRMAGVPGAASAFDAYCASMRNALHNAARGLPPDGLAVFVVGRSLWAGVPIEADRLIPELGSARFAEDHAFSYSVKNRHMSYSRRNGADIDREYVVVLRKKRG